MNTIDILVASVLVLIMFGIGVSLTFKEVEIVIKKPKALIISLTSQMILLPFIAFGISFLLPLPTYIKIGLVILASSPGGTTSGFITYLFKGNVALSIILTTVNSILTLISIPLIVNFALTTFTDSSSNFHLPIFETMKEIFILTAIPASIGVLVRHKNKILADNISKYAKPILMILLAIVFILKFFGGQGQTGVTQKEIIEILPTALLLNIFCFIAGFSLTKFFKLGYENEITTSVESAVHNTTMAFLISGTLLHNEQFGKVSLVYAMFSFWTALIFCYIVRKLNERKTANAQHQFCDSGAEGNN
jgi:BASS family bile acid:Na+ symporter